MFFFFFLFHEVVGKESAGTINHFPISCVLHFKFVASFLLVRATLESPLLKIVGQGVCVAIIARTM